MRLLIATDSFKDALSAAQAAAAIARGLGESTLAAEARLCPLSDGGEGACEVLADLPGAEVRPVPTVDALGRPRTGRIVLLPGGRAYVPLTEAAGLELLGLTERDPELTSTYGLGLLLRAAVDAGARDVTLAVGGSATQDLGLGLLRGLGYALYDAAGATLAGRGADLARLARVKPPRDAAWAMAFAKTRLTVLCDVENPLLGARGSARTYARQKGASDAAIDRLEAGGAAAVGVLERFRRGRGADAAGAGFRERPGAGAAGGVAAGLLAVHDPVLRSGGAAMLELVGFAERLAGVDLVVVGEGSLDDQTTAGKLVRCVVEACRPTATPVVALCGSLELTGEEVAALGLAAALPIGTGPRPLAEALARTETDLVRTARALGGLLALGTEVGIALARRTPAR